MASIHGHEVLHMMLETPEGFASAEALTTEIVRRFGADARFHTCSAEGLDARGLVDFLAERGKFVPDAAGFNTRADKICSD